MTDREILEQKLLIQQEVLNRLQDDPWYKWQPNNAQRVFVEGVLCDLHPEAWFIAGNRAGKSDAAAYCGAALARFGRAYNPKYQITHKGQMVVEDYSLSGWVISLDFPNSRDVMQPKYFDNGYAMDPGHSPFIPDREIRRWSVSNQILELKNGNFIGFKSADVPALKFAGAAKDWIQIDEPIPELHFQEATMRVGGGRMLQIFGAATILPGEGERSSGIPWLYEKKIVPWEAGEISHDDLMIYSASTYDNPHISAQELKRLEALYPPGTVLHDIRLLGQFRPGMAGARAYHNFDKKLHVRDIGEVNSRVPLIWCWDFNVEPMVTIVGQKIAGEFHVFDELWLEQGSIEDMVEFFRDRYPAHRAEVHIYGDATGNARKAQSNQSDYQVLMNLMRNYPAPVRLRVPEANPPVKDRINAVNMAMLDEEKVSRVYINPQCKQLVQDLVHVQRDSHGGIRKTSNRRDSYFFRTHASDAFGYWIVKEAPVRALSSYDMRKLTKVKNPSYSFGKN